MREVMFKVFRFDELSEEAKEKAITNFLENHDEYIWLREIENSAKAIAKVFGIQINFEYDGWNRCYANWSVSNCEFCDEELELSKARLIAWIVNRFDFKVLDYNIRCKAMAQSKKGYYRMFRWAFAKNRYSDNMLTGYCDDYCTMEAYKEIIDSMKKGEHITLETFFDTLCKHFAKAATNEIDYQNSDEFAIEMIEANDYEFYEDGDRYID